MADGWTYSGLRPIQRGAPHRLLQELFDQLFRWSKDVTERHEEFPAGFTEWTMAGHFAVAASQPPLRYFPFQDYNVKLTNTPKTKGKGKVATKRPDLHLRQEGWSNSCIFEFKRQSIPLAATAGRDLAGSTVKSMKAAYSQLTQVANGNDDWARYLCPTVGMTVWLNYMVNGRDHWASKGSIT